MGEDEGGTLAAIKAHRKELIEPKAKQYHGRTVKLLGDGALMEFPSVVDALRFAVEVQSNVAGVTGIGGRMRRNGQPADSSLI